RTDEMCGQRPVVCFPAVLLPCVISNTYHIDISRPDTLTATEPVEAQISRIKRCIGARLLTRKTESQQHEGVIIANLVNLWNSFGKAVCIKNA
ncbi:hypothetical protein ACLFKR_38215, partial [Paraburkholderia sp. BR14264]